MKIKVFVLLLLLLYGCNNTLSVEDLKIYSVQFRLNLPKDSNGYYCLKLDPTKNQTIHRIDGMITPPIEYKRFEWKSNLKFSVWNYTANATNIRSYTNKYGLFSNVIGPVAEMKGDTMRLTVRWDSKAMLDSIYDYVPTDSITLNIVLE